MTRTRHRTRSVSKGKPAQINRVKRRLLHAIWPHIIAGPVGQVALQINYFLRVEGEGLTAGEIAYLKKREETLQEVHADLMTIYFRLKK